MHLIVGALLQENNRALKVEILPDFRKRITRRYDIVDQQAAVKDVALFDANVRLAWGTEDDTYTGCRLVGQTELGQIENPNKTPNDPPPFLLRVFEELPANDRVIVGEPGISYDQYGFKIVVIDYVQLSDGTTPYSDVVGSSTAPSPNGTAVLKTVEGENNGTVRTYHLTYTTGGEMSDTYRLLFGGKVTERTLRYLNQVPPTPSGYTLVGPGVEYVLGLPLYEYKFVAATGSGGTPGTNGEISRGYTNSQGGDVAFNPASPNSATGEVICTIRYISTPATTSNPVTQPTGFVLFAVDVQDEAGYRLWETKSGFGGGNSISVDVQGAEDGALIYTVSQNDAAGSTVPAYPGSGTVYNIKTTHTRDNGFWKNTTVWHKPPATATLKQTTQFEKPGNAVFTGSPPQLVLTPPVTLTLLADMEVSYNTSQISDTPFTVSIPASFYENYTPTDTGVAITDTVSLGRYLAGASSISGTNDYYNGVLCDTYAATLVSSTPSSFPSGATVIYTKNDIYLVDVAGVIVYRRTKISYTF